ncbi:MAG TPA: hypothetical protein PKG76_16015 [Acidobacteriota bacterium]|nr:hypothetical protein [Acidobacteriota bacterium]
MNMKHIARARILAGFLTALALTGFLAAAEALDTQLAADTDLSGYWQVELRGIQTESNADKPVPYMEIAYMWMIQGPDNVLRGYLTFGDSGGGPVKKTGDVESQDVMGYAGIKATGLVTASRFWLMGHALSHPDLPPLDPNVVIIVDDFLYHAVMAWGVTGFEDMIVGKFHYMIFEGIPAKNSIGNENYTGIMGTFRAYKIGEIEDVDY